MIPPAFIPPQIHSSDVATYFDGLATGLSTSTEDDSNILIGDIAFSILARETYATSGPIFPDFLGVPPLPGESFSVPPPITSTGGHATFPIAPNDYIPYLPSPSPSLSQASTPREYHPTSPHCPSPAPEPSCRHATPSYNHIRNKWSCSGCDKDFRGKWECNRHIKSMGKQARCTACGGRLNAREDSLIRHFTKYCKGDLENLRFEDAFVEI